MGPTNPKEPIDKTPINQQSLSRLASINSIDDWCTFGPLGDGQPLANEEDRTVAWCTKPRNNARVIPDGTLTSVHFVKTPLYVQVMARGDFTKIGFVPNDNGGELDPHGASRNSESSARAVPALLGRGAREALASAMPSCASARSFNSTHILPPAHNAICTLLFSSARGEFQKTHA